MIWGSDYVDVIVFVVPRLFPRVTVGVDLKMISIVIFQHIPFMQMKDGSCLFW